MSKRNGRKLCMEPIIKLKGRDGAFKDQKEDEKSNINDVATSINERGDLGERFALVRLA